MNSATININARYRLEPYEPAARDLEISRGWDVIDKARELQFLDGVVFSNGTEAECREWVLRNCEEPVEHARAPFSVKQLGAFGLVNIVGADSRPVGFCGVSGIHRSQPENEAHARLFAASPRLLALLEQYHATMPTKESGKLICEARGWLI